MYKGTTPSQYRSNTLAIPEQHPRNTGAIPEHHAGVRRGTRDSRRPRPCAVLQALFQRQLHRKGAAHAHFTCYLNAAAVGINDSFADCQAEPVAALGTGPGFVGTVEALEDVREVLGCNALARIGDLEQDAGVVGFQGDPNLALLAVELDGVRQQVGDDLAEALGVALALDAGQLAFKLDTAPLGQRADQLNALPCHPREVDLLALHRFLTGIEAGKFEQ